MPKKTTTTAITRIKKQDFLQLIQYQPKHPRKALKTLEEGLQATKIRYTFSGGKIVEATEIADWDARIRSAHEILALGGGFKHDATDKGPQQFQINLITYTATAGKAQKVIDAKEAAVDADKDADEDQILPDPEGGS
ncbi:MAG: hypothetical protein A3D89_04245 [Planctomycetes bacterium RIFCSPHIGHO2_02_FULL_52_58]|nr:MAG: hypothetical protein A3D89_04245 [Planctomycetes bacterium RIFCSPHIGHO2_02_FULL_52_58]